MNENFRATAINLFGADRLARLAERMGIGSFDECKAVFQGNGQGMTDAMRQRAQEYTQKNPDQVRQSEQQFNAFFGRQ